MARDSNRDEGALRLLTPSIISEIVGQDIDTFQLMDGGRNNHVARFESDGKIMVCKVFNKRDASERYQREVSFLRYCHQTKVLYTPKLLYELPSKFLFVSEYIEGSKPQHVNDEILESICSFIGNLNTPLALKHQHDLHIATDALSDHHSVIVDIERRLGDLWNSESEVVRDVVRSIKEYALFSSPVREQSFELMHRLISSRKVASPFVSPSDIGLHNMITNPTGTYFIDFEYAGLDSPMKLFMDISCHPDLALNDEQILKVYAGIKQFLGEDLQTIEEAFKVSFVIKWCLIMLKTNTSPESIERVLKYARNHGLVIR